MRSVRCGTLIARADLPVEVPSGWNVERGDDATSHADTEGLRVTVLYPDVLISLAVPRE